MTTLNRLDAWKQAGVITPEQHASLTYLTLRDWFSLYVESHALLALPLGPLISSRGDRRLVRATPATMVVLDREGVAVRTGHHCCQPLMERFDVPATARASLALYSDRSDVDALVAALHVAREVFA